MGNKCSQQVSKSVDFLTMHPIANTLYISIYKKFFISISKAMF